MASPINEPGFLTRIVKRIRAATQDSGQGEDDAVPVEAAVDAGKEQKRRDDAIRRREFDHLRKVRAQRLKSNPDMAVRLSTFQNSSTFNVHGRSLRGRARTVGKINAIEAELAQQWWANSVEATPTQLPDDITAPPVGDANPAVEPQPDMDLDFTGLNFEAMVATSEATNAAPAPIAAPEQVPTLPMEDALGAALDLFGQGLFDKAESALVALLQSPQLDDHTAEACSAALLNLYHVTGDRASFDTVAIEYAQLFGRSAPEWRHSEVCDADSILLSGNGWNQPQESWVCPAKLGPADMVALQALANQASAAEFDWSQLVSVDPEAAKPLLDIFAHWASQNWVLHFKNQDALLATLSTVTPLQDRATDPVWWRLRLEVLRVLGLQAAFDDVAIDYCVTYEISPPAWVVPRCTLAASSS